MLRGPARGSVVRVGGFGGGGSSQAGWRLGRGQGVCALRDEAIGELPSLLAPLRLAIIGVGRRNWPCSPGRRGRAGQDHGVCVDGV